MFAFQISFAEWPSDIFHGDFYDMYIAGRPYEDRYAALRSDLQTMEQLVKKNFLSAHIIGQVNVQEYRDTPKLTRASFYSQLGATMNLWAGITVVVFVEMIELFYDAVYRKCETNKRVHNNNIKP